MFNRESWLVDKTNETERRLTELSNIVGVQSGYFRLMGWAISIVSAAVLTGVITLVVNLLSK